MQASRTTFSVEVNNQEPTSILKCHGSLVLGENTAALGSAVEAALAKSRQCRLNLGEVTRIDAHGIGVMMQLVLTARKMGGSIQLAGVSPRLRDILGLTGVMQALDSANDSTQIDETVLSGDHPWAAECAGISPLPISEPFSPCHCPDACR